MPVNQIVFQGRLGRDAEMTVTSSGKEVTKFSVGSTRRWNAGNEVKEETTWLNITAWNGVASGIVDRLVKGKEVTVVGSIAPNQWEDKDGNTRRELYINAREIVLGADAKNARRDNDDEEEEAPARKPAAKSKPKPKPRRQVEEDYDDDEETEEAPW